MSNLHEHEIKKPKVDLNYSSDKKPVHSDPSPEAKPLPKVTIDGKAYEFKHGDTIEFWAAKAVNKDTGTKLAGFRDFKKISESEVKE